jgi:hypothetical protein
MIFIFSQTFLLGKVKDYIYKDVLNDPTLYIFRADAMLGTGDASQITKQAARDERERTMPCHHHHQALFLHRPKAEGHVGCRMSMCVSVFSKCTRTYRMRPSVSSHAMQRKRRRATGDGRGTCLAPRASAMSLIGRAIAHCAKDLSQPKSARSHL